MTARAARARARVLDDVTKPTTKSFLEGPTLALDSQFSIFEDLTGHPWERIR